MHTPRPAADTAHQPEDIRWMRHAISLANNGLGQTHPNPQVGAVVVANGHILAEGWHAKDGGPHAEIVALDVLRQHSDTMGKEATLYVTLEPCSTHGRTGACTEAILKAGIRRVVIGAIDPAPCHAGRGIDILREAGVEVVSGVLSDECADLNLIFNHRITTGQPLIAAKIAVTLDGRIAARSGDSRWITGEAARADVMRWRRYFPAIGVGAGTVLGDDPQLTARLQTEDGAGSVWYPQRLVFDRHGRSAGRIGKANLYREHCEHTSVVTADTVAAQFGALAKAGGRILALPKKDFVPQRLGDALRNLLAAEGIGGLYVEGGAGLLSHLLAARAIDYLFCYRAPKILADLDALSPFGGQAVERMRDAFTLQDVRHATFGDDQLLRGKIVYPPTE